MSKRDEGPGGETGLTGFGRYAGPATLILSSLADGPKHGYALTKDVEEFAGVRLAPGTLYEALARLESQGLIDLACTALLAAVLPVAAQAARLARRELLLARSAA